MARRHCGPPTTLSPREISAMTFARSSLCVLLFLLTTGCMSYVFVRGPEPEGDPLRAASAENCSTGKGWVWFDGVLGHTLRCRCGDRRGTGRGGRRDQCQYGEMDLCWARRSGLVVGEGREREGQRLPTGETRCGDAGYRERRRPDAPMTHRGRTLYLRASFRSALRSCQDPKSRLLEAGLQPCLLLQG